MPMTSCKPSKTLAYPHCGQESPERKYSWVALVIGVGEYQGDEGLGLLENARTDAEKIHRLLFQQGAFDINNVLHCFDPTRDELFNKLAEFEKRVEQ